jgi:hypothetical protein
MRLIGKWLSFGRINSTGLETLIPTMLSVLKMDSYVTILNAKLKFFYIGSPVGTRDAIGSKTGF